MKLKIYNQEEMSKRNDLIDFMLDTIIHNLSYLYGPYMDSKENRQTWKDNNIFNTKENIKFLVAEDETPLGFIIYQINTDKVLVMREIEINKNDKTPPLILFSLLKELSQKEYDNFDCVQGFINKKNKESMKNFMRYASYKIEKENGFYMIIDREQTQKLKEKIAR